MIVLTLGKQLTDFNVNEEPCSYSVVLYRPIAFRAIANRTRSSTPPSLFHYRATLPSLASRPCSPLPASSSRRGGRIPSLERWSRAGNFDLLLLASPRIGSPQLDSTRLDSPQLDSTRFVSFRLARLVSFSLASPFLSRAREDCKLPLAKLGLETL